MHYDIFKAFLKFPTHPTFWVTAIAWLGACFLKVFLIKIQTGHWEWKRFFASGGMPSSHMAFASALTASIAFSEGPESAVFGLSLGLTILTAVDAVGVRRAAGLQAELLNRMAQEFQKRGAKKPVKLKETLGHTGPEMLAGILVGVLIAFLLYPASP